MNFDEKIVLQQGTVDKYGISCLNPDGSLIGGSVGNSLYSQLIDYDGGDNPVYIGEANPGSIGSEANPIWRIKKLTYDVNGNVTILYWADGDTNFNNIWNNRASLTYS